MRDGPPLNVVIAGAERAGLEAMFGLHRLAGRRARAHPARPERGVQQPRAGRPAPVCDAPPTASEPRTLASAAGAEIRRGCVSSIDVDEHHVITTAGETVTYNVLPVALGAVERAPTPRSLCFGSDGSHEDMHGLVQDVEAGYVRRIAFVMLPGATWPVALSLGTAT